MSRERRMYARGSKKIESQRCLREKAVAVGEWKTRVNGAASGNKMILEGACHGAFGCMDPVFLWGNSLTIVF